MLIPTSSDITGNDGFFILYMTFANRMTLRRQATLANLHTLRLGGPPYQENGVPSELLQLTPALRTLILTNLREASVSMTTLPLKILVLKSTSIMVKLPRTLTHFTWEPAQSAMSRHSFARVIQSQLPCLTHLSLFDMQRISAPWLSAILDQGMSEEGEKDAEGTPLSVPTKDAAPLQFLSLKGTLTSSTTSLFSKPSSATGGYPSLFTSSPRILTKSLKHLAIPEFPCDDDEIEHLISHDLRLEYIDLSSTNITGAAIKMLADGMPTLKHIRADHASRINGRDAIVYAERKGIRVSCSMSEPKGGKKVRYL
jgi:F-box/TPR repeat protein Pof3